VEELARLGADLSMRNQHCLTALDIAVRKTRLLRHFYILKKTLSLYQDRLGTNIHGKLTKKVAMLFFLRGITMARQTSRRARQSARRF
jgi:hypothetical protein